MIREHKAALFARIDGVWRFEGFMPANTEQEKAAIRKAEQTIVNENGPYSAMSVSLTDLIKKCSSCGSIGTAHFTDCEQESEQIRYSIGDNDPTPELESKQYCGCPCSFGICTWPNGHAHPQHVAGDGVSVIGVSDA